ncbi:YggS family pyridoxal phosphate-dependent enzyme [Sneathiella marina]|uniref:Pyridoxal phosphate homeostasis protein n=1 Tax=Sneathiella marina TaxID=2950108 RepID=A0ABY4W9W5_9PROT|nr:YggS family pyridoxal phosphate-dependent enzyme [Sneathiella marina]USG61436.1 YggS family pyridoxal phosphate-dependent enzyme [Sneathiella marina]
MSQENQPLKNDVSLNLADVQTRIITVAQKWGRKVEDIDLIAVSKRQPVELVRAALQSGHRIFGENRVQEAEGKWPQLKSEFNSVKIHLIGPLQTNKAKEAIALFDCIQTVDRMKLAKILAKEMRALDKHLPVYIQVNTGKEPQKAGVIPEDADAFIKTCITELNLNVIGLMCIPPVSEQPAPHFALLAKIAARHGLSKLSMGMSADYETGIQFGATSVRVGTAIFGMRTG